MEIKHFSATGMTRFCTNLTSVQGHEICCAQYSNFLLIYFGVPVNQFHSLQILVRWGFHLEILQIIPALDFNIQRNAL